MMSSLFINFYDVLLNINNFPPIEPIRSCSLITLQVLRLDVISSVYLHGRPFPFIILIIWHLLTSSCLLAWLFYISLSKLLIIKWMFECRFLFLRPLWESRHIFSKFLSPTDNWIVKTVTGRGDGSVEALPSSVMLCFTKMCYMQWTDVSVLGV